MNAPILYLLVGPQGAGKTTYAKNELSHVKYVSQDELGKKNHWNQFNEHIANKESVIVDRLNFSMFQRYRYINLARANGYKIHAIYFDVDKETCLERLEARKNHRTISINDDHDPILNFYFCNFQPLDVGEYDTLTTFKAKKYAQILDLRPVIGNKKFIVVGDIHGCFDEFINLLGEFNYESGDFVISCGDLVDRGNKVRETIEWFMKTPNAYVVEGNHDNKARRYWKGNKVKVVDGLAKTIEQCEGMDKAALVDWIASWPQIIQVPDIEGKPTYVVHAGIDPKYSIDKQSAESCIYLRFLGNKDFYKTHFGGRDYHNLGDDKMWYEILDGTYNVLSGHIIHDDPKPFPYIWCLDGGAFKGKKMRGVLVENGVAAIKEVDSKEYYTNNDMKFHVDTGHGCQITTRDKLVEEGLLRSDNLDNLRIYTYTKNCEHARQWDEVTLNSRGIILNVDTGEVVARPFSKFFNLGEKPETMESVLPWDRPYRIFEKLDGWLGILYRHDGQHKIATRGSFGSDGAVWATNHLQKNHRLEGLPDDVTLVFEIISPVTRIIVNYGDSEKLVLLAAFNRHDGSEYAWEQVDAWGKQFGFEIAKVYYSDLESCKKWLKEYKGCDKEGFVIRFENGVRVKMKAEDYLNRASLLAHMSPVAIWELMQNGEVAQNVIDQIDSDYHNLFYAIYDNLRAKYVAVRQELEEEFKIFDKLDKSDRKAFAQAVFASGCKHPSVMFALLDKSDYNLDKYIKKQIRPNANKLD